MAPGIAYADSVAQPAYSGWLPTPIFGHVQRKAISELKFYNTIFIHLFISGTFTPPFTPNQGAPKAAYSTVYKTQVRNYLILQKHYNK